MFVLKAEGYFWQRHAKATFAVLAFLYAACILVSYLSFVAFHRAYTKTWLHDVMGLLDTANRLHVGQVPYRDFHLFYGPLVALIPALGLSSGLKGAVIFGFDSVIVAAIMLPLAVICMARRLTLPAACLVFLFVWLMIVVPLGEGRPYDEISWGTYYNRHGWAALMVILLFYLEPELQLRRDIWIDAITLAALVLFEIYTKFSFALVAFGFVVANGVVSKYNRRVSVRSAILIILAMICLEALFHFHAGYWANIAEYASKAGGGLVSGTLVSMLVGNAPIILACCGAWLGVWAVGRRNVFDILFVLGSIIASMLVRFSIGDDSAGRLVALFAVLVCLAELARRAEAAGLPQGGVPPGIRRHAISLGCLLLALIFVSSEMANRAIALENYVAKVSRMDSRPLAVATLPGAPPNLSGLLVYRDPTPNLFALTQAANSAQVAALNQARMTRSPGESLSADEYARSIVEGMGLLSSVDYRNRTVFAFEMVNPFTYALDMRPARNGYPQFWLYGAYKPDPSRFPQPQALFSDIDYVMVPRLPYAASQLSNMMSLYGAYLNENYAPLKSSPHWDLWQRKAKP